ARDSITCAMISCALPAFASEIATRSARADDAEPSVPNTMRLYVTSGLPRSAQRYHRCVADRVFNFGAGPATLPRPVLEQVQFDLVELPHLRMSPLEVSHRSIWFEDVIREAELNIRGLLAIPDGYHVLFVQGGASLKFSMVAMNLLRGSAATAEYVLT